MVPSSVTYACDNAKELIKKGNIADAIAILESSISRDTQSAQLYFELGSAYRLGDNLEKASVAFLKAAILQPDFFAAIFNLASALRLLNRLDESIYYLEQAKSIQPEFIDTYINLGSIFNVKKEYEKAVEVLKDGIKKNPKRIDLYVTLAESYIGLQNFDTALSILNSARYFQSDSPVVLNGVGNVYLHQNELGKAKEYYCNALRIKPDMADAHCNLGNIMRRWNQLDEAVLCFQNSLRFKPKNSLAMNNLGEALLARGDFTDALAVFQEMVGIDPTDNVIIDNLLLLMNYDPDFSAEQIFNAHKSYCSRFSIQNRKKCSHRKHGKKLRVGYLSPDFCKHPSASILLPLFKNHDSQRIEFFGYSQTVYQDEITEQFRNLAYGWRAIEGYNDREVFNLIQEDQIDILVDCAGHMSGNRLGVFALQAAPLQITGIGYPNTTGLQTIDYRLSDAIVDPCSEESYYTEKLLRLENGFCCYEPLHNTPSVTLPPVKRTGNITFGSTHTLARLNQKVLMLWADVLRAVPDSRLLIVRNTLCESVVNRLSKMFAEYKIDPQRIIFQKTIPDSGHMNVYKEIDILLDTFPWSGHVTACEALWMGVPVVTLKGDRFAGRMVSSILSRVGLNELIAEDQPGYIHIAQDLAFNTDNLVRYRMSIREQMINSSLCDYHAFTRCLEENYMKIWEKYLQDTK